MLSLQLQMSKLVALHCWSSVRQHEQEMVLPLCEQPEQLLPYEPPGLTHSPGGRHSSSMSPYHCVPAQMPAQAPVRPAAQDPVSTTVPSKKGYVVLSAVALSEQSPMVTAGQPTAVHTPPLQVSPAAQRLPHAPQLFGSLAM